MNNNLKTIRVRKPATDADQEVNLTPESSVADLLRGLNLNPKDVLVQHDLSGTTLESNDELYNLVEPGDLLLISPQFRAGRKV